MCYLFYFLATEHAKQGLLEAEMFVEINFLRKEDIGATMNKQMIAYPPLRARRHKLRISKGRDLVGYSPDPYPLLLSFTLKAKK